jgi:hypothetical protein
MPTDDKSQVALHFATAEEEHYDKDGAIWCIDIAQARSLLPKILLDGSGERVCVSVFC